MQTSQWPIIFMPSCGSITRKRVFHVSVEEADKPLTAIALAPAFPLLDHGQTLEEGSVPVTPHTGSRSALADPVHPNPAMGAIASADFRTTLAASRLSKEAGDGV
jgi:hypothetical protein